MGAAKTIKISDDVREILSRAKITERELVIDEQLERSRYDAVKKAIEAAGGKWNRKAKSHLFERDPRQALGLAVVTGEVAKIKTQLQAFYTPDWVADIVVEKCGLAVAPAYVLEPSCGPGALVRAVHARFPGAKIHAFDMDGVALGQLELSHDLNGVCEMVQRADFLTLGPNPYYDLVLMNPPFADDQDAKHVLHALRFVKPGGELLAIASSSCGRKPRGVHGELARALTFHKAERFELPEGAFQESGTGVRTSLLRVVVS